MPPRAQEIRVDDHLSGTCSDTGVEPLLHMSPVINVLREDELKGSVTREDALANAPATDGVYFKVPKVIRNPSKA